MMTMSLDNVRGRYRGRSAVVMGAGPSLRLVDQRITRHVTIAVNDAISKVPDSEFYVSDDPSMLRHWHWDVVRSSKCLVTVPEKEWGLDGLARNGVVAGRVVHFPRQLPTGTRMLPSDGKLIYGPSSAHTAVSLAVVLGCSPVYLVGCDCRCVEGKKYFWEFPGQNVKGGMKNGFATHVLSEMKRIGKKLKAGYYDPWFKKDGSPSGDSLTGWRNLRDANPDVKIIDASGPEKGGALAEVFPTVSMHNLLNG